MTKPVRGHFQGGWVDHRGGQTEIFLEGATAREAEEMLKYAHPGSFFPSATMRERVVTAEGQRGYENPLGRLTGHADLMYTRIEGRRDGPGVVGRFEGFLHGSAPVEIRDVPGGAVLRETGTRVTPDLTRIPVAGTLQRTFEDNVPIAGAAAKLMRRAGEEMMGKVFEGVHVMLASTAPSAMADTINRKRRTGRW